MNSVNPLSWAFKRFLRVCTSEASGFTVVEVLVASAIFMVGIAGIAGLAGTAIKSGRSAQALSQAVNYAQDRMEALQSIPYSDIQTTDVATTRTDLQRNCTGPTGTAARPVYTCTPTATFTANNRTYTWTYTVTLLKINSSVDPTLSTAINKRVDITVRWTNQFDPSQTQTTSLTSVFVRE